MLKAEFGSEFHFESRDNQHFNTLLCLFQFWSISLISVSYGFDMREEHAKVAYQFRGC